MFDEKAYQILTENIMPFWDKLRDDEFGGFYGQMDNDLVLDKKGTKGVILNSRILWFYSQSAIVLKKIYEEELDGNSGKLAKHALDQAEHAYRFLMEHCLDREQGGVYWMMNYDGSVNDSMKHTYNQAFAIYALSTYYLAGGEKAALDTAFELFDTVESKCTDDIAYMEAFDRNWQLIENDALSENGLMADKTMNTVLHLIEAYTVLYKASGEKKVADRLRFLLDITDRKIYDHENKKLLVFFDRELNVIGDIHSYGHDIEASWLIDRACDVLGDEKLRAKWEDLDLDIVDNIMKVAYEEGDGTASLKNERDGDKINTKRIWWVQAEAVVGLVNAFMHDFDPDHLLAAEKILAWIDEYQTDKRCGEWFAEVDENGKLIPGVTIVNEWKCPYHNGRMCLELLSRHTH